MARRFTLAALPATALIGALIGVPLAASATGVERRGSDDPIQSSIALFERGRSVFAGDTVVITRVDDYADGIAATPLAAALKAPVLLTGKQDLDTRVLDVVRRTGVRTAIIVGGTNAVSDAAEAKLGGAGVAVQRVAGSSRYATATAVAAEVLRVTGKSSAPVFVATGLTFPDALAGGAVAAKAGGVVVLSQGPVLDAQTLAYLRGNATQSVLAVGGSAVKATQAAGIRQTPLAGSDRYGTARLVAEWGFDKPANVVMTSGLTFPHSIAASAYAAQLKAPLLLTLPTSLPRTTADYLAASRPATTVVGGARTVADGVVEAVWASASGAPTTEAPTAPAPTASTPADALPPESTTAAPPPPPAPSPSTPAVDVAAWEQEIYRLTNAERAKHGKPAHAWDDCLAGAARAWSGTLTQPGAPFKHSPDDRGAPCSEPYTGENIAAGYAGPVDAVAGWMNSPGHRANILGDYASIGVGVAIDSSGSPYYTQIFAMHW